jgi:hypothetical protein
MFSSLHMLSDGREKEIPLFELFITYVVGALVGGTILALWIRRSIWPYHSAQQRAAERFEARRAFVHRIPD